MKKALTLLAAAGATVALATPAFAVTASIGNAAVDRATSDSWRNFTIVDTNNPAPFDGYFTQVDYFVERVGDVRFVIVDASDTVTWVSDVVSPTATGAASLALSVPVGVTAGSNLGVYSLGAGVISFDYSALADPAEYESYNAGLPVLGETLSYVGASARFYSMKATVNASSPEICKNGGWESYGYKNQGQCIASVVANDNSVH